MSEEKKGRIGKRHVLSLIVLMLALAFSTTSALAGRLTDTSGGVNKPAPVSAKSTGSGVKLATGTSSSTSNAVAPSNPDPKRPAAPTPYVCNDPPCDAFLHLEPSGLFSENSYGQGPDETKGAYGSCPTCTGKCLSTNPAVACNPSTN